MRPGDGAPAGVGVQSDAEDDELFDSDELEVLELELSELDDESLDELDEVDEEDDEELEPERLSFL